MTTFDSKGRHEKLAIAVHVLQNTYDIVISRSVLERTAKKSAKIRNVHTDHYSAHQTFYLVKFSLPRRRGLLKIPTVTTGASSCILEALPKQRFFRR